MSSDHFQSSSAIRRNVDGEARAFVFDVLVDGKPVQRATPVVLSDAGLLVDGDELALDTVFWVSRRAGLMLLFGRERTLAVLGKSGDLEELARGVERGSDRAAQRSLLQPLTREVVVCTAGTAVSGNIGDRKIFGLHLAVFTQRGLHLFAGSRSHSVEWPVETVSEITSAPGTHGRGGLRLVGEQVELTLRYLFPEEIQAVARVAVLPPDPVDEPEEAAIEMFAKGEVAPPPEASLPEFSLSAEALSEACETAARRVDVGRALTERLGPGFFERHFQDLGEIALGPLMLRKSAAASERTLARAVVALDAEQLRDDADAAFRSASDHLFRVFQTVVESIAADRRIDRETVADALATPDERERLVESFARNSELMTGPLERVLARQHMLMQRLQAAEHAPPEAEDESLDEAADEWKGEILSLDRAYGEAWSDVLVEIADTWSERLVPRLRHLATLRGRRLSENTRLVILAAATFTAMGVLAWLVF
ncbi:MAG: hypothetical protein OEU54_01040 [Gemmatimonadota bacterium]|nr:hypothetical protein [Gemmatimonadota bacterium]